MAPPLIVSIPTDLSVRHRCRQTSLSVIAARLAELGHDVTLGTRDVEATLSRTEPDAMGNPTFASWKADHQSVDLATFEGATMAADLVVNATNGSASLTALDQAGASNLAGKVILDIANPLDFSGGIPPTLFVKDTDSLGEQIQRGFPEAKVVKALNTVAAPLMVDPKLLDAGDYTVFVSGNDGQAKVAVTGLLIEFGHTDVIDRGDITTARGPEMMLPVWLRLWGSLGTPMFGSKIVR